MSDDAIVVQGGNNAPTLRGIGVAPKKEEGADNHELTGDVTSQFKSLIKEGFEVNSNEIQTFFDSNNITEGTKDPRIAKILLQRSVDLNRLKDLLKETNGNLESSQIKKLLQNGCFSPYDLECAFKEYQRGGPAGSRDTVSLPNGIQAVAKPADMAGKALLGSETVKNIKQTKDTFKTANAALKVARGTEEVAEATQAVGKASQALKTAKLMKLGGVAGRAMPWIGAGLAVIDVGIDLSEACNARPQEREEAWAKVVTNVGCCAIGGAIGFCLGGPIGMLIGIGLGNLVASFLAKPFIGACFNGRGLKGLFGR
ncbi:MAG: hypothetical protein A3B68_08005 [Candidatus Melainabacteria bacterium RIFCSPHIGHO2_02_FULL_34_12]|nr:MAG: hypothetical protein A3B68_08005 [Candidatus Melainabacteria bacterium RIFCSPHIGHO2_02_FULL_34_12]